jgi:ribosomal protein L7/L12
MERDAGNTTLPLAAIAALQAGNKIEAIKIFRQERGTDLKDAKDAVEAYIAAQPALREAFAAAQAKARNNLLTWGSLLVLGALVLYFFLKR